MKAIDLQIEQQMFGKREFAGPAETVGQWALVSGACWVFPTIVCPYSVQTSLEIALFQE